MSCADHNSCSALNMDIWAQEAISWFGRPATVALLAGALLTIFGLYYLSRWARRWLQDPVWTTLTTAALASGFMVALAIIHNHLISLIEFTSTYAQQARTALRPHTPHLFTIILGVCLGRLWNHFN